MNFTVVSAGVQYDRLAIMYLGDTEVWRTSTAEPTQRPGIRWTYMKDMTQYLSMWRQPQKVIFDLGNLINENYTAPFNTTLTAIFFQSDVDAGQLPPADAIIPISARKGAKSEVSQFTVPQDNATNTITDFPRNARRAIFSVSANGQANEEFWWGNVLHSDRLTFNETSGEFTALSPWREVQVLLDDVLIGVQWPFPVIFTGGIVPSLHRPVVGIDAFDLREHEIDITPWLPLLCDGKPHTFKIQIAGIDDTRPDPSKYLTDRVYENWYVTGKIFVWLDEDANSITTGGPVTSVAPVPAVTISRKVGTDTRGANSTLDFTLGVTRELSHSATVKTQKGTETFTWKQSLSYRNRGILMRYGFDQVNDFLISGEDTTTVGASGAAPAYYTKYAFPLGLNMTVDAYDNGNLTIGARLIQGLELTVRGASVYPTGLEAFQDAALSPPAIAKARYAGSRLSTSRDGEAWYFRYDGGRRATGYGGTTQVFTFGGLSAAGSLGDTEEAALLFVRNVSAINDTVIYDRRDTAGFGASGGVVRPAAVSYDLVVNLDPATSGPALDIGINVDAETAVTAADSADAPEFAAAVGSGLGLGSVRVLMSPGRMGLLDGTATQAQIQGARGPEKELDDIVGQTPMN